MCMFNWSLCFRTWAPIDLRLALQNTIRRDLWEEDDPSSENTVAEHAEDPPSPVASLYPVTYSRLYF